MSGVGCRMPNVQMTEMLLFNDIVTSDIHTYSLRLISPCGVAKEIVTVEDEEIAISLAAQVA